MTNNESARRLAEIGREEHRLMHELRLLQRERCQILRKGLDCHSADLGISAEVTTLATEPKEP